MVLINSNRRSLTSVDAERSRARVDAGGEGTRVQLPQRASEYRVTEVSQGVGLRAS
jgi:hypothetical protein